MINITIVKKNQTILTIEASGHSGYAEEGSDIVCSAVSTLMISLINGLTDVVKIKPNVKVDEEIPLSYVNVPEEMSNEKVQTLMQTTALALKGLRDDGYSKFIKIKEKQHD
ncbi:MAG: ribosomal-processing cysteine protease Prp [Clostridiales bacterium]|nr:ribosomal-processing cysteine protease Prp [Clostridiales bacterium]